MPLFFDTIPATSAIFLRKMWYACIFFVLSGTFIFSLYYCLSGYEALKTWYLLLNNSIYEEAKWGSNFFTPAVKTTGNYLAVAGCVISITGILYVVSGWRKLNNTSVAISLPHASRQGVLWYSAVFVLAILIGINNIGLTVPDPDELNSIVCCARLPAFQCISYYMLPNNHMYFNFINHVLFSWSDDMILSGRLISLVAYTIVLISVFHWFYQLITKRWLAFIALLPVALQFAVWAFATQARGYECQLACGWLSFISIMHYVRTNKINALRANTLFNILGIAFIPTYLYLLIAEMLFVVCIMAGNRTIWPNYFKYQLIGGATIFLLYLPAFCFSGIAAFTSNAWVLPTTDNIPRFLFSFVHEAKDLANSCFFIGWGGNLFVNYLLFLLPMLLFFSKQKEHKLIALFYTVLWVTFILFCFQARRTPPFRVLIIHFSLTMAFVIYTFYFVTDAVAQHVRAGWPRFVCSLLWMGMLLSFCVMLFIKDRKNAICLYGKDSTAIYESYKTCLSGIPTGSSIYLSTIYLSDYDTYYYYLCRKMHLKVSQNTNGNEDFYIKSAIDTLPVNMSDKYTFVKTLPENCTLFKRKY